MANKRAEKIGFTLAEVLITLGIIGVVASLTIPILQNKSEEQQQKTAYKKAYSMAYQAVNKANGEYLYTGQPSSENPNIRRDNFKVFMSQFKTVKKCENNNNSACWNNTGEKFQNFWPIASGLAFIDSSGMSWSMISDNTNSVIVDTNGLKPPNQYGKDRFALSLRTQNNSLTEGIPVKIQPYQDNPPEGWGVCDAPNKCATEKNYFGTSWLYK